MRRIGFILGSGVSIKAGYDSVQSLTETILRGENIYRHTNGKYYKGEKSCDYVNRITQFINFIFEKLNNFNTKFYIATNSNYEDIYYILRQIHDEIYGEQENLIVREFIDNLPSDRIQLCSAHPSSRDLTFGELVCESMTYINNVVANSLKEPVNDTSYLSILSDLLSYYKLDIFSLNHDLMLESYFGSIGIDYCDGFEKPLGDLQHFNINLFTDSTHLNIIKLHGSSNWYRFRKRGSVWHNDFIGKCLVANIDQAKDENGDLVSYLGNKNTLLIGSFNKLIDYNSGIYSQLLNQLTKRISNLDVIFISGYGFCDKGINSKIIEWLYLKPTNKIVLIHGDSNKVKQDSRGAVSNKWDSLIAENKLLIIEKWFEEIKVEEILHLS